MSAFIKDGGPAFPHLNPNFDGNWDKKPQRGGMSLRDWFAGQALVRVMMMNRPDHYGEADYLAKQAYHIADAMLAAREGKE